MSYGSSAVPAIATCEALSHGVTNEGNSGLFCEWEPEAKGTGNSRRLMQHDAHLSQILAVYQHGSISCCHPDVMQ